MGHTLHDILSKTEYVRFHGYETTLDFVELPSSFLENWCWKKDVLKKLSCHYTTLDKKYLFEWRKQNPGQSDLPREIPDHWIEKLAEHRYFNRALFHLRQLYVINMPFFFIKTVRVTNSGPFLCSIFKYIP